MSVVPKTIECTITSNKKVTHVVSVGEVDNAEKHYATSATHACNILRGLGIEVTPPVVYRHCSKNTVRKHNKPALPENVRIERV